MRLLPSGPITMEIKLCIFLRLLAGACYLDMIWYGVQLQSVLFIFIDLLRTINEVLSDAECFNFHPSLPNFHARLEELSAEWAAINLAKFGGAGSGGDCGGLIAAGDGYVAHQVKPTKKDLQGRDVKIFRNRKGCYGLIVQAFCDAYCMFVFFEVSWPGSTPDIT